MADLPAVPQTGDEGSQIPGSNFIKGATGMPVVRQVTLLMALAASLAMGVFVAMWMQEPDYRVLSAPESAAEMADVVAALEGRQIEFTIEPANGSGGAGHSIGSA